MKKHYTKGFFKERNIGALKSAEIIVPIVLDLIHPKSVVDVGCALGEFLYIFKENGVEDILGIDGE
jgi:ribosomal protein L11 methylase PrmA